MRAIVKCSKCFPRRAIASGFMVSATTSALKVTCTIWSPSSSKENVGMVDRAQHSGFLLKALQAVAITGKGFWQNLDRDLARQTGVACAIDFPHAARTD